jgi:hypothetical protein
MSIFTIRNAFPTIVGAVVSTIALSALPSYAGTITGVSLNPGTGGNSGTIAQSGSDITVSETFVNLNTIVKNLTVTRGNSGTYNFVVDALNNSGRIWDTFRFNLNANGNNRPEYVAGSFNSNLLQTFTVNNNNGFLEFTGGTVAVGQTARFVFSVAVPTGYNSDFSIGARPFSSAAAAAVPTPAALPAMIGFGAGLLRKRRQNKAQLA